MRLLVMAETSFLEPVLIENKAVSGSIKYILIVYQSWRFSFGLQVEILYHVYTHNYAVLIKGILFYLLISFTFEVR